MGEKGSINMYNVKASTKFSECVYDYEKFNLIREAQDLCNDIDFDNNEVNAMTGEEYNTQIVSGAIPLEKMCSKDPLNPEMCYIFRRTMSGKYIALHVTMRPNTEKNLLRGSMKYGSMSIDRE